MAPASLGTGARLSYDFHQIHKIRKENNSDIHIIYTQNEKNRFATKTLKINLQMQNNKWASSWTNSVRLALQASHYSEDFSPATPGKSPSIGC